MGVGTSRGGGRKDTGSTCRSEGGPRETGMGWVGKGLPEGCWRLAWGARVLQVLHFAEPGRW